MLLKQLMEFGLSEKEAKTYLVLLELEIAGVHEIAKAAGLNRSSTYVTLESLKKQGLVSVSDDKKVRRYLAVPPETMLRAAEDKANAQEKLRQKIEAIVPEMKALFKGTKKKPIIKVYEGEKGITNGYIDTLNTQEKLIRVFSSPGDKGGKILEQIPEYVRTRAKLGIRMLGIHPDILINKELIKNQDIKNEYDEYALVPHAKYKCPIDLAIYDDKIGYLSDVDGGLAIIIESKEMSNVMKDIFDLAFEEAKRLNKKIKR